MKGLYRVTLLFVIESYLIVEIFSHGMMMEPPNRSSVWRLEEFSHLNATPNYNDNHNYCGGFAVQHILNNGSCGICGDPFNQPQPRDNEDGGMFDSGVIVRKYKAGQVIPIEVNLTQVHGGYFELRLCAKNDVQSHLDQSCYDKHLLELVDYKDKKSQTNFYNGSILGKALQSSSSSRKGKPKAPTRFSNVALGNETQITGEYYKFKVRLPKGVKCTHCVLQWHWRTGNNWGECYPGYSARGCGPQETYQGCADIAIR